MTTYFDTNGDMIETGPDMAILSSEDHISTLPPVQALLAAASPIGLFAYWHETGAVLPVGEVVEPEYDDMDWA